MSSIRRFGSWVYYSVDVTVSTLNFVMCCYVFVISGLTVGVKPLTLSILYGSSFT
jgi:hypothetical protein